MIKHSLGEEVGLNEKFLGFIDGVGFIGTCAGLIYITLFPLKKPRRDYLLYCIVTTVVLALVPLS